MIEFILGLFLLGVGGWMFFDPKGALDFKVKMGKKWGIKMVPSAKTYKMYKYLGIVLAILGLLVLL